MTPAISVTLPSAMLPSTIAALFSLSFSLSTVSRSDFASAPSIDAATHLDAAHVGRAAGEVVARRRGRLRLELRKLALGGARLLLQLRDARLELGDRRLQRGGDARERALLRLHPRERALAGRRLDAADAGRDAALAGHLEQADVAGARDVRAAAQLARAADVEHAHVVAVLLAEQHHRAELLRLVDRHRRARWSAWFSRISALTSASTRADLVVGQRRVVREVEARALGVDQRALLLHVRAEHLAQRLVHQVRRRVVAHRAAARSWSTLAATVSPTASSPVFTSPTWPTTSGWIFCVSSTSNSVRHTPPGSSPRSPTWPPDSA